MFLQGLNLSEIEPNLSKVHKINQRGREMKNSTGKQKKHFPATQG